MPLSLPADAAALYSNVCKALGRPENAARAQGLAAAAAAKLEELDKAIAEAGVRVYGEYASCVV